jgi:DNA replication protein DnaC
MSSRSHRRGQVFRYHIATLRRCPSCASALKNGARLPVLEIHDFGLATLTELQKQDLLEAIEERYGSGATVLTSQLPIGDWHAYLGTGRIADAILDRLIHNAHRIELNSKESLRKDRAA